MKVIGITGGVGSGKSAVLKEIKQKYNCEIFIADDAAKKLEQKGILRMMDEQKDCKDVITQLSAVRSAVDRTIGVIVTDNLVECLSKEDAASLDKNEMVKQAVELLVKSR